jgi:hypothetical protein
MQVLGYILGNFFTNSSGRPETNLKPHTQPESSSGSGVDIMITIVGDFRYFRRFSSFSAILDNFRRFSVNFRGKNWRFSQKPMLRSEILQNLAVVC